MKHDQGDDEQALRRDRVVNAVLSRIASAPGIRTTPVVDIATWAVPALAAAVLIMAASVISLVRATPSNDGPGTLVEALGLAPPMTRFVATGDVDTWGWLVSRGGPR